MRFSSFLLSFRGPCHLAQGLSRGCQPFDKLKAKQHGPDFFLRGVHGR